MKQLLFSLFICLSLSASAQKKDTSNHAADTIIQDSTRYFYLILTEAKWNELINLIKTADEKPSKIKEWEAIIIQGCRQYVDETKGGKK